MYSVSPLTKCAGRTAVFGFGALLLFLWSVLVFLTKPDFPAAVLVTALLFMTAWSYGSAALTDPGTPKCEEWNLWAAGLGEEAPAGLKQCRQCKRLRPERAHHCRWCGVCVLRMDHHCPLVGNCIGWRNHKSYILTTFWGFWASLAALLAAREPKGVVGFTFFSGKIFFGDEAFHPWVVFVSVVIEVLTMSMCAWLFVQDMYMAARNLNRIEILSRGPSAYSLWQPPQHLGGYPAAMWRSARDNFRQLFGKLSVTFLLPFPPEGRSSDGTHFPVPRKEPSYSSCGRPYE